MSFSKTMRSISSHAGLSAAWGLLLAAIMPVAVSFGVGLPRVALGNFTDSVFYLSYARQFSELVLRYGFPYYATRFGGILPDALSGQIFGDITGIWVLRWMLTAGVSATLFLCFRKRYGLLTGLLASLLWSFNPAALRLLCTTYVDSTSVPFLILGSCLVIAGWGSWYGLLLAGCFFALAASAHLYAAFALILIIPLLIGARWSEGWKLLRDCAWVVIGCGITFGIAWLWYWAVWGMPSLFGPTIDVMQDLGHGQASQWKKPTALALHETPAWFAPLALLLPLGLAARRGSPLVSGGGGLSLLLSIGFFWGGDLFGSAYVLSMPFYYSFLLPVVIVTSAILCGEIVSAQSSIRLRCLLSAALALAAAIPTISSCHGVESRIVLYSGLASLMCLLLIAWGKLSKRLLVILSVATIGASVWMTASTGIFRQMLGYYKSKDIPVLELATALKKEIPTAWVDTKVTRFWYDDNLAETGGSDRRMIGSFWLHTFGKLVGYKDGMVSFPVIPNQDANAIASSGVERIVIFDQKSASVDEALKQVEESRLPFTLYKRITLHAASDPTRVLEVAILKRQGLEKRTAFTLLDFSGIHCGGHEKIQWIGQKARLSMNSNKWWNQARLPLPPLKRGDRLCVSAGIESGLVRFILGDDGLQTEEHTDRWASNGIQEVVLAASMDLPHPDLRLRSLYPNHSSSRLVIEKVVIEQCTP